ncbi:hypothetical protein [Nesterenkonia lutea]|uniref:Uncharacterized protein n=1 Tax=Nesterenkonia lutea TaxID=272919 RepID=A0ABR9JHV5_9MICC|nr:hypothetical protein [Nesterenkonia lutea]MBE1525496.1 hypothetical protein [Nesterenkonia lutea]
MGQITPDEVPAFPQYVIDYDEEAQTARLDGVPIEPAAGVSLREAALTAAARKADTHGLDAVRVTIRSNVGEEWKMIVSVHGETIDTTPPPESKNTHKTRRRTATVLGGVVLLMLVGGGTAVAVHLSTDTDQDQDTAPPWETPGANAQVPVGLPDGFTGPAAWSVDINDDTGVTGLDDGRILTANSDGILSARHPETAEPTWAGSGAPADLSEIHESTWAGAPVLASYSRGNLNLWPIEEVRPGDAVAPEQVPVDHTAELLWEGDAPLVSLGDFVVLVPDEAGTLTEVTIPAGSQPVSAVEGEAVSIGADAIYRTGLDGESTVTEFTPPGGVEGRPEMFWTIGTEALVLAWSGNGAADEPVIAVMDQDTGETIIKDRIERLPNESAEITYNTGSQRAVIGALAIRYDDDPSLNEVPVLEDPVLAGNTLYGNTTDGPAQVDFGRSQDGAETYPTFTDDDTAPLIVADDAAYVVAPRLDETILYRAPADVDEADDAETSENGDDDS